MKQNLAIFEGHEIRRLYDEKTETWLFSVVDIVQVLTQQPDSKTARKYWNKLKERLGKEGSQLVTNCHQLKLPAADGKNYLTDVANAETLLRLVQSVPSPKARADQALARQSRLRADGGDGRPRSRARTKVEENLSISAGAAQPSLSTEQIKGFVLPLPSVDEQERIVEEFDNFAEETQRLARLYERKHAALEALKKSLLHQAFTGAL